MKKGASRQVAAALCLSAVVIVHSAGHAQGCADSGLSAAGLVPPGAWEPTIAIDPNDPQRLAASWMRVTVTTGTDVRCQLLISTDGDGWVGFADLETIAESWGAFGVDIAADLNGDGTVGAADLSLFFQD